MAEAFTLACLGKIGDILLEEIRSCVVYVCCFNSNIKKLNKNLKELQTTQQEVQQRVNDDKLIKMRAISSNVVAWQESAMEVSTKVNGILQDMPKVKEGCLNGWCPNLKMRYSLSRKAVKKIKAIDELLAKGIQFQYTKFSYSPPPACMRTIPNEDFSGFESRKTKMEEIIEALKDDEKKVIGISGLPGVGKTKMAREVGKRVKDDKLFDEVTFVTVAQYPDLRMVQKSIANSFGLEYPKNHDDATTRASLLRKRLSQENKRILLILDDVWEEFDLEEQGIPLKNANGTFKFLYSSRSRGLWHDVPKKEVTLELLSKDEAWQLFRDKVGDLVDARELKGIANQIVDKCKGLPLTLVIIGGILSRKSSKTSNEHIWKDMLCKLTHIDSSPPDENLISRLELSYKYLEREGKTLFLLCCVVKEDKSIAIEDLARYALGLSLFQGTDTMSSVRHRVFTLVDDLKKCYFLLDDDDPQTAQSVKMHDLMREMGLRIAFRDKVALVRDGWPKQNMCEYYTYISVILGTIPELHEGFKCRDLELLLLRCRKLEKLPGKFFEGMEKLKVSEIKYFHGNLTLQCLRNLTMLSLEGFGGMWDNISVIGELLNLEILSFRGSSIKELPEEVRKLVKLRLLDLSRARMWIPPNVISHLTRLEELYIGDNYINAEELKELSNLNILQIVESTESGPSEVTENISPVSTTSSSVMSVPMESDPSEVPENTPVLTTSSSVMSVPTESGPSEFTKALDDAIHLHHAFQGNTNGTRCDKSTIVNILAHRNATQRSLIMWEYKTKFSEDLHIRLSKELGTGDLKEAVLLWMREPGGDHRDAKLVQQALTGEFNIAIEIICSRTPSQIQALKMAYRSMFGVELDKDIGNHSSYDHKQLLLAYVDTTRSEGPEVDAKIVEKDAKELYKDGVGRLGINEATFIRIFTERSSAHLAEINSVYRRLYGHSLKKAVTKETSGKFKFALLTILQCAENPGKYFAKALYKALNPLIAIAGIDKKMLTRIIVSRAEIDIEQIKAEYEKKNRKSLSDDVHSKTSGNYRSFLILLLNPKH